jgi:N utilization substance protein B
MPNLEVEETESSEVEESCSPQRQQRSLMFHLLYAMEAHDYEVSLASIIDSFNRGFDTNIELDGELARQTQAIIDEREALEATIKPLLANWRLERVGLCTRIILRMATWELLNSTIGPKIILNEAIELAKCFSERDAYKFVNGILDELLKRLDAQRLKSPSSGE